MTSTQVRPDDLVRAKIDEQVRALAEYEQIARVGVDPEGVHQMRVAVRRLRAALKAGHIESAEQLQAELKWLGGALGAVRDLDVQLEHLRGLAADFEPDEQAAVERLLKGLLLDRRRARKRMLGVLHSRRYAALLESLTRLATVTHAEPPANGEVPAKKQWAANLVEVIRRLYRKLGRDAEALGTDPPDDDLHALRIRGKRLRYAAELAAPVGGKRVQKLIKATKGLQDVLGDHQDAVVAEQEVRRLLIELPDPIETEVVFVAGRLVERERARRADCRARWRDALAEVESTVTLLR